MTWRRALLMLLVLGVALAVLAPQRAVQEPAVTGAPPASSSPPDVQATLPADETVKVPEGRVVELRVTSLQPDIARIDALGLQAPVGPGLDGPTMTFVAEPAGRFPVRLDVGGTQVGTIEIVAPRTG